jgi:hypothetical protein
VTLNAPTGVSRSEPNTLSSAPPAWDIPVVLGPPVTLILGNPFAASGSHVLLFLGLLLHFGSM